jgi:hypothetical protein
MASNEWQEHEMCLFLDEDSGLDGETDAEAELRQMISELRDGDALSIVPMAKFAGWQCHVRSAEIDVEVEIWH